MKELIDARVKLLPEQREALAKQRAIDAASEDEVERDLDHARAHDLQLAARLQQIRAGAIARRGLDAEQAAVEAEDATASAWNEIAANVTTPRMHDMLRDVFDRRVEVLRHELGAHVGRERLAARRDNAAQLRALAQQDAIDAETALGFATHARTVLNAIDDAAGLNGTEAAEVRADKLRAISAIHAGRIARMLNSGRVDDALAWRSVYERALSIEDGGALDAMLAELPEPAVQRTSADSETVGTSEFGSSAAHTDALGSEGAPELRHANFSRYVDAVPEGAAPGDPGPALTYTSAASPSATAGQTTAGQSRRTGEPSARVQYVLPDSAFDWLREVEKLAPKEIPFPIGPHKAITLDGLLAVRARVGELYKRPEVKAFLDLIAYAEGTEPGIGPKPSAAGYYSGHFPGPPLTDLTTFRGEKAIGRYQLLRVNWANFAGDRYGITDFSPVTQDIIAIHLLDSGNVAKALLAGDLDGALKAASKIWASIPENETDTHSQYNKRGRAYDPKDKNQVSQPVKPWEELRQIYWQRFDSRKKELREARTQWETRKDRSVLPRHFISPFEWRSYGIPGF